MTKKYFDLNTKLTGTLSIDMEWFGLTKKADPFSSSIILLWTSSPLTSTSTYESRENVIIKIQHKNFLSSSL